MHQHSLWLVLPLVQLTVLVVCVSRRAKSVCSMSDFQRLMDSSPFLPVKSRSGDPGQDDVTPPLSPDDLKYIEEFNNKGWDFPACGSAEAARSGEPLLDPFQPASWFLTTSATLTTSTLSSPERCHRSPLRAGAAAGAAVGVGVEHCGIHILHSPSRAGGSAAERTAVQDSDFSETRRWASGLLEGGGGLRTSPNQSPICPAVGFASSLELQLSRNLSDDMKEVAISVRNAIRSPPPVPPVLRESGCQTNGLTSRGTQTTQSISVGLQTDLLRTLTSSPHRCLTPKGGGTPASSPSRAARKVQYSPVVQSKFERPCCSPKYGSPKLQRKLSAAGKAEAPAGGIRSATPTTPQKGNSESAWARSTTTRDSPVHTTINDGLSSLFNIIDHTPVAAYDATAAQKFNKSPSRSRPTTETPGAAPGGPHRGRSPSPVQLLAATEMTSERQDLSAPPGHTLAENAARILNKKLQEQSIREERRRDGGRQAEADRAPPGCLEVNMQAHWIHRLAFQLVWALRPHKH